MADGFQSSTEQQNRCANDDSILQHSLDCLLQADLNQAPNKGLRIYLISTLIIQLFYNFNEKLDFPCICLFREPRF